MKVAESFSCTNHIMDYTTSYVNIAFEKIQNVILGLLFFLRYLSLSGYIARYLERARKNIFSHPH